MRKCSRRLLSAVPIETVNTMGIPADDPFADHGPPETWGEYEKLLAAAGLDLRARAHSALGFL